MRGALLFMAGIAVLYFTVAAFLPSECAVERSIIIQAPAELLFEEVNNFQNWQHWSPWKKSDSPIVGSPGDPIYKYIWKSSDIKISSGILTRVTTLSEREIKNDLYFTELNLHAVNIWKFENDVNDVKVTCTNILSLPLSMRMMSGKLEEIMIPDLENGLAGLKKVSEKKE